MKAIHVFTAFTYITAFIFILTLGYWYSYHYVPVVFKDPKFPVLNKKVKQGGIIQYVSNYCKYMESPAVVSRSFVNGLIFNTPPEYTNRDIGCHTITVGIQVPHELPPGIYHLENSYTYQVNPIRTVTVKEKSENFEVIEIPQ